MRIFHWDDLTITTDRENEHCQPQKMAQEMAITPSTDNADILDPACDPNNPIKIEFDEITSAAFKIKDGIYRTPCDRSRLSDLFGIELYLKKDLFQYTGNFKERGARNAIMLLDEEKRKKGVIAASAGNHAQALSYHGRKLGVPVTVVMPLIAPIMKVSQCRKLQAEVIIYGANMAESKQEALRIGQARGLTYINGYDHRHILAGAGTIGLEVLEQAPDIEAIVVPCGGGGLMAGISLAVKTLKPGVKVIGTESEKCPGFSESLKNGKPTLVTSEPTLADGLAVPLIGCNAFATAKSHVDKMAIVKEESIAIAILRFIEVEKCVVEGAGATSLAACIEGKLNEFKGKKICLVVSGGNIDTSILGRCMDRGLAADGRLVKVTVCISDRPGGFAELIHLMASIGVNIKDCIHERAWVTHDVFSVDVTCICETTDAEHAHKLRELLKKSYKKVYLP